MRRTTTLIIGAGQAGLAMSYCLTEFGIDHVLLERGQVANSWRTERWDSLRLLSPNWQSRLPGYSYQGDDPDGFRTLDETIRFFDGYSSQISAPIETETDVLSVEPFGDGYIVRTTRGDWQCRAIVIATGYMSIPSIPTFAKELSTSVRTLSSKDYRNPEQIEDGGVLVIGPSASGVQIAQELQLSGKEVVLSVGEHVRLPRSYRGLDIMKLMDVAGIFDHTVDDVDDLNRVRRLPSMQLIGSPTHETIGLNTLQAQGVEIVGRSMAAHDNTIQLSGSLANVCQLADLKMNRLLRTLDAWIEQTDTPGTDMSAYTPPPTNVPESPCLSLDLKERGIKTIIWATGFRPDYSWLNVPVINGRGRLRHTGGIVEAPGLYAMGLPFMRKRKSNFIDGAADDARALSSHLNTFLSGASAAQAA
ncbi:MAG: NAD(P)-binding domain-containing protein [Pseudomonadota bacterium]